MEFRELDRLKELRAIKNPSRKELEEQVRELRTVGLLGLLSYGSGDAFQRAHEEADRIEQELKASAQR